MAGELITGSKAVKDELEALLRKIEFWHQGQLPKCEITLEET
jgi:hypothetical protein